MSIMDGTTISDNNEKGKVQEKNEKNFTVERLKASFLRSVFTLVDVGC
jgi:hypothetical protein